MNAFCRLRCYLQEAVKLRFQVIRKEKEVLEPSKRNSKGTRQSDPRSRMKSRLKKELENPWKMS